MLRTQDQSPHTKMEKSRLGLPDPGSWVVGTNLWAIRCWLLGLGVWSKSCKERSRGEELVAGAAGAAAAAHPPARQGQGCRRLCRTPAAELWAAFWLPGLQAAVAGAWDPYLHGSHFFLVSIL